MSDPKLIDGAILSNGFLANTYFQEDAAEAYQDLENKAVAEKTCFLWWCWNKKPEWLARNNIADLVSEIARCEKKRTSQTQFRSVATKSMVEYADRLISAQSDGSGGYSFDEVGAAISVFNKENPQCHRR